MDPLPVVSPEAVGIPSGALLALLRRLSQVEYLNSLMILRHGKLCLEFYLPPYRSEVPHQLFSLSKSFTSCAIGLAQQDGLLDIHDPLIRFFPDYADCITDERMKCATLEDLLTMRSGHLVCATKYTAPADDWVRAYLSSPLDCQPGTTFCYNSAASYMLASVIRRVTGENVREYLMPRLFEPLAITPGIWECCPGGTNFGGWGLHLTTGDIAKFAQLLLQHGVWQGRQLLPQDYLAEAVRKHADNSMNTFLDWQQGYGYQFWRSRHGYRGDGSSGQYAVMLPEEDMAIAVTSCTPNMAPILDAFWEEILPHLSDTALPENPAAVRELSGFAQTMALPLTAGDVTRRGRSARWELLSNEAHISAVEIAFGERDCTLTFTRNGQPEQLRAGFGFWSEGVFQLTDRLPHPVAASAAWRDEHTLEIRSFITDGIYRDVWTVDFADAAEPVKNQGLCGCFRPVKPRLMVK